MNRTLNILTCSLLAAAIIWGCKKEDEVQLPVLTTTIVTEITENAAKSGGTITTYGDKNIIQEGVCWATHSNPTVQDSCSKGMAADLTFTSSVTGLLASNTYYLRAYATSSAGTGYGNEVTFVTQDAILPEVTGYLYEATQTTAKIVCDVITDGGLLTTRGVCWSTNENPTTSDSKVECGTGMGGYSFTITGLTANSNYYARSYATNALGTVYGKSITVRTMYGTVTDADGNVYKTVLIGTQEWMAQDLRVTHYRNGDQIPYLTNQSQWSSASTGAYCYYDNNTSNALIYGAMYNWYAATDSRGIAPVGWHIPSKSEVNILIAYLGGASVAGGKMKEAGTMHWISYNSGANNSSGFTARGGGYRVLGSGNLIFYQGGELNGWWTTDLGNFDLANLFYCTRFDASLEYYEQAKNYGYSIRCVKD